MKKMIALCALLASCQAQPLAPPSIPPGAIVYLIPYDTDSSPVSAKTWKEMGEEPLALKLRTLAHERCKRAEPERCPMPFEGTTVGFFLGSNRDLWATAHTFEKQALHATMRKKNADEAFLLRSLDNFRPRFLLLSAGLEVIFDTEGAKAQPELVFLGDPVRPKPFLKKTVNNLGLGESKIFHGIEFREKLTDFIHIRLPRDLSPAHLKKAPKRPGHGEAIFLASPSGARALKQGSFCEIAKIAHDEKCISMNRFFVGYLSGSKKGESGSPILNQAGEVIGLHTSGTNSSGFAILLDWANEIVEAAKGRKEPNAR